MADVIDTAAAELPQGCKRMLRSSARLYGLPVSINSRLFTVTGLCQFDPLRLQAGKVG